jgi:hypothetical protein
MAEPLYRKLLRDAAKHGNNAGLKASKERAALLEGHAKDAAARLGCKPTDQAAMHYATLALSLELIQTQLVSGKQVDVGSLRWLSEELDKHRPPDPPIVVDLRIVDDDGRTMTCDELKSAARDRAAASSTPPPPPADVGFVQFSQPQLPAPTPTPQPAATATAEEIRRGLKLPDGSPHPNTLPRRDPGSIHNNVLPNGQPARMVGQSYAPLVGGGYAMPNVAGPFSVKNEPKPNFDSAHSLPSSPRDRDPGGHGGSVCW